MGTLATAAKVPSDGRLLRMDLRPLPAKLLLTPGRSNLPPVTSFIGMLATAAKVPSDGPSPVIPRFTPAVAVRSTLPQGTCSIGTCLTVFLVPSDDLLPTALQSSARPPLCLGGASIYHPTRPISGDSFMGYRRLCIPFECLIWPSTSYS